MNAYSSTDEKYDKINKQQRKDTSLKIIWVIICLVACIIVPYSVEWVQKKRPSHRRQGGVADPRMRGIPMERHETEKKPAKKDVKINVPVVRQPTEEELSEKVERLYNKVRKMKDSVKIFETDPKGKLASAELQEATRDLLHKRYGKDHDKRYRIQVVLEFQDTIPDFKEKGKDGTIVMEMAPSALQPHSIFMFMENARKYQGGAFHRTAGHVLQVMVRGGFRRLAFQEYSPEYPHKKGTVGYAGRPSGPAWYISIQDNTNNHGPGSQQKANPFEADSCFGTVIQGFDDVVPRIKTIPGPYGFKNDPTLHVKIIEMHIMVPSDGPDAVDGYVKWVPNN